MFFFFNGVLTSVTLGFGVDSAFAGYYDDGAVSRDGDTNEYPNTSTDETQGTAPTEYQFDKTSDVRETNETDSIVYPSPTHSFLSSYGLDSFGDPAQLVAEAGQTFADELEEPVMDRPWFCSAYAAAGYFLCDPLTNVPKWCQWNMSDVLCPDEAGHEYVIGGGGSSGGAGVARSFEVNKCYDSDFKEITCQTTAEVCKMRMDTAGWVYKSGSVDTETHPDYSSFLQEPIDCGLYYKHCIDHATGNIVNCSMASGLATAPAVFQTAPAKCYATSGSQKTRRELPFDECVARIHVSKPVNMENIEYSFDRSLRLIDYPTGTPITNEKVDNGYPIYVPIVVPPVTDPFEPVIPDSPEECATIICQCIAAVVRALGAVNASVLKVDESVLKVVSAVTDFKPDIPEPLDFKPVTDELQRILKAIDDITVQIVEEAGTNFWDVLGGAFGDIFDLIEFLIEKVIYLVIPEDSSSIVNAFDLLRADLMSKVSPIHAVQQHITDSIPNEQREFENIAISLPRYGEVTFFKTDYLLQAIPFIRQLLSAIMVLLTAIWAYRKVSSEMIK